MLSNGKKDDDSSNSFGIESTIVQFEDCTSDDISVNLEFYFGNQLASNETFRVSFLEYRYMMATSGASIRASK